MVVDDVVEVVLVLVVMVVVAVVVVDVPVVVVVEVAGGGSSMHSRIWHGKVAIAPVVPKAEGVPIGNSTLGSTGVQHPHPAPVRPRQDSLISSQYP